MADYVDMRYDIRYEKMLPTMLLYVDFACSVFSDSLFLTPALARNLSLSLFPFQALKRSEARVIIRNRSLLSLQYNDNRCELHVLVPSPALPRNAHLVGRLNGIRTLATFYV